MANQFLNRVIESVNRLPRGAASTYLEKAAQELRSHEKPTSWGGAVLSGTGSGVVGGGIGYTLGKPGADRSTQFARTKEEAMRKRLVNLIQRRDDAGLMADMLRDMRIPDDPFTDKAREHFNSAESMKKTFLNRKSTHSAMVNTRLAKSIGKATVLGATLGGVGKYIYDQERG